MSTASSSIVPPCLATSLAPVDDRAVQPRAVQSWLDAGFCVVSVNTPEEIATLSGSYPGVRFVPATQTGEAIAGRPVPYIGEMIHAARTTGAGVIGIINADIVLDPTPDLAARLTQIAQTDFVLGPRVDVTDTAGLTAPLPEDISYSVGYDYFLFPADFADALGPAPFCIGMPFWDYWLPMTALLHGYGLKTIKVPIARHLFHETRWDDTIYFFFHTLISDLVRQTRTDDPPATAEQSQIRLLSDLLAHVYAGIFDAGTKPPADLPQPAKEACVNALATFYDRVQETVVHHIKTAATSVTELP